MGRFLAVLMGALMAHAMASSVRAGEPVVVELYTSQGCYSCPPADALLGKLAQRDDVIALALHVDYWDYIGWKDSFGDAAHSQRQKRYARAVGDRMVYTPQMIIGGVDRVVGNRAMDVADHITDHLKQADPVAVALEQTGQRLTIRATTDSPADMLVQVVRYRPSARVKITRGENRNKTLDYHNIVVAWDIVAEWDGRGDFLQRVQLPGDEPVVVIVQREGYGPILGAKALR